MEATAAAEGRAAGVEARETSVVAVGGAPTAGELGPVATSTSGVEVPAGGVGL